jgi:predicted Fe-Mo cluster-binding NifX family protein
MKICIPTEISVDAQSKTSGPFGRAPFFTLVDTETGDCRRHPGRPVPRQAPGHRTGRGG